MGQRLNAENMVNLYTGQVAFPINLASIPGRNGFGFEFNIFYNSNTLDKAEKWNLEAPTGIMGLGWTSLFEMIFIDTSQVNCFEKSVFLLRNGTITRLMRVENNDNNEFVYKTEEYAFWKIVYYPKDEKWEITHENGDVYIYGDAKSNRDTVQWSVEWAGWLGISNQTKRQAQVANAWNLSKISNRFSDAVTFYYANNVVPVGSTRGLGYTQASYLVKIEGARGDLLELNYLNKDSSEYQCPYPSASFAYQQYFEKKYLDSISRKSPEGNVLATHQLEYGFIGEGSLKKRVLCSVKEIYAAEKHLPDVKFSYYGQDESDGVSAVTIYNSDNEALYGAIKQLTLPEGGTVSYKYGTINIGNSLRHIAVNPPESNGVHFSDPRFYIEDDYVVATWYGNNSTVTLQTYVWDGRWLKKEFNNIDLECAYEHVTVKVSERHFIVYMEPKLYIYIKDISEAGEWILGRPLLEGEEETDISSYAVYSYAENQGYMMGVGCPSYGNILDAEVLYRDSDGNWQKKSFKIQMSLYVIDELTLYPGTDFVVLRAVTRMAARKTVQFSVVRWNKDFSVIESEQWGITFLEEGVSIPEPQIFSNLVAIEQRTYRFDGVSWNFQDISTVTSYTEPKNTEKIIFGEDMAIRKIDTADSCIYELIVYNPDSGRWYIPDGLSIVSANSGLGCAISQTQGEPVKAVILAGKVLYRDTEGRWEEKFTIPDGLSAKGIETIRFPSPQYFLYQLNTGESSIKTVIYFLKNGEVVSKRTELPGESMFMGADSVNGLVGHNAFVSYLGGNQTEQADTFYLRRVVSGAVKDKQAGCIVKSITLNNGYMDIMTGFRFEESSACIDSSGLLCRFNKASVLWGTDNPEQASYGYTEHCFFNGLTKEESPAVPYPLELDYTNAGDYYSTVKGLKYCMYIYDSSNNLVSTIKDFWWVYMNDSGNTTGFYVRKNKQEKMLDGVTGTTEYLYSRDTGLLLETCTYNYNALDELEKLTQQFKYWWEVYDTERSLNLLTPVVQTTCKVKNMDKASETTVSSNVTTWKKEWGQGKDQWFPYKSFCALNGDVMPFNAWGEDDNPPTGEWLEVGSTELITSSGMILESKDAKGISTTRIYDQDGFFVTTEIQNASFASNDLSYLGFETYEDIGGWGNSSSQALVDNIIDWDYYTGSRCLKLNAAPVEGLFRSDNLHRAYVFGCNAKVENGFNSNNGKALWEIAVYKVTDNTEVGTVLTIDLSSAVGKWDYFQKTIDLEQIRESNDLPQDTELYFIIKGYNLNQTKYCLVDNLRVLPTDALFSAAVYEPSDLRIKAVLDNNGQAENILYNAFLRPIAAINAKQGINAISIAAYSRNLFGTDSFKQQFPNLNLVLGTSSDSSYDDFHDGSLEGWKFTDPQKWGISKNELTYTGTSSAPLGEKAILDTWAYTNFAFRIIVKRQSSTPPASVAIGDGYYLVRWKEAGQNSQWELSRLDTSGTAEVLATFTGIGFKEEWIFIVVDGFVMFYADGIPIFCYKYEPPSSAPQDYGKPTMYIDKPGAFDEMIILREPQLSIGFEDGFGTTMQSFALAGRENAGIFQGDYSVAWQGAYFDDLGRIQYICNPLTAKVALAPYERSTDSAVNRGVTSGGNSAENNAENSAELIEGDTDTYLYDSQGQKLSKSEYLSADVIDYCTQIFEPSPLSRISQIFLPREKASDIDLFTTSILRTGSSSIETANPSEDGLLNRFYVEKISKVQSTDKNNVKSYIEKIVMYDLTGKIVRELVGKEGAYREKRYIYNASGDLATIRHPNYFDASFGSEQVGFADTMEYTFAGLLKKHTTPDSNTTEYIYDKVGELRFVLDAEGAKQNPQRIAYLKYDSSKRVIETGYISDPAYPWGAGGGELQPYADNPSFPVTEPSQLQNSNYAVGLWKKRFFYDMDLENPDTKYMLGRLWKVQVNNGGQAADEEYYRYDSLGNIISQSVKSGGFDNKIYEFNYEYNNQGRVISVIYPSQGEAPFKVGYYYDRLGRQACIGEVVDKGAVVDPSNPPTPPESRYASYYHNSSGFMVRELLNNSPDPSASNSIIRDYSFNNKGMLKKIKDGYFEETLDYYENGGYNDFKYYDGNIASLSFNYKTGAGNQSFPGKYNYKFQYDSSGRLVNGIHSLGNAWSVIEPADSPSYDANGNILKQKRGATTKTYQYAAAENAQINNRVQSIESSIDAALDFEGLEPAAVSYGDWNWGSSNGGASESGIFTDDKHSGTQCLRLTGGSLGHYEFLLLKTFLEPVESLKLTYWLKTSPGFDQYRGDAGWLISIYSAAGGIFTKNIKTVAAAEDWTKEEVEINLRGLVDSLGSGEEVCYATLELRNCKGASNQESQVYLLVDDISINGRGASQNHEYNYNGDITKSPERGIDIIYDPITRLTTSIKINGTANSLEFAYGASNQRLLEELKSSDSSESFKKLYLNGLNSSPLMEKTNIGGVEKTTYYIYGRNGLLAAKTDEKWIYPLKDHLGSARMLVEEDGNVKNWYDYMPFGELMGKDEADGINYLYTGQEYDAQSGLYNYRARFYDPALKRFYGTDPAGQYACPYVYTGNNPVNRIDPTGCIDFTSGLSYIESAVMAVLLAYLGYKGLLIYSLIKRHDASEGKIPLNSGKIFQDYIDKYVSYEWNWGKDGYKKRERIGILQQANDSNVMRLYNPLLKEEKLISFVLSREEPGQLYRKFNFVLLPVNGQKEIRLAEVNSCFEDREINVYHSELAKGLKVDCAGELIIDHAYGDKIWTVERVYLKPKTGHYYKLKGEPAYEEFENCPNIVIEEMKRLGYTNIKKEKYGG